MSDLKLDGLTETELEWANKVKDTFNQQWGEICDRIGEVWKGVQSETDLINTAIAEMRKGITRWEETAKGLTLDLGDGRVLTAKVSMMRDRLKEAWGNSDKETKLGEMVRRYL